MITSARAMEYAGTTFGLDGRSALFTLIIFSSNIPQICPLVITTARAIEYFRVCCALNERLAFMTHIVLHFIPFFICVYSLIHPASLIHHGPLWNVNGSMNIMATI